MDASARKIVVQEIARYQPRLRALVRCLLVRASDVDDILQDINAVLWEKADEFQPGTDFWAWASQIARFKALNQLRRYGRERLVFDEAILGQLANVVETRLHDLERRHAALNHCLQQLPPAQRQLLDLRYSGEQTPQSIAQAIGRPEGSIRQTLYRIRQALLAYIEGQLALGENPQ